MCVKFTSKAFFFLRYVPSPLLMVFIYLSSFVFNDLRKKLSCHECYCSSLYWAMPSLSANSRASGLYAVTEMTQFRFPGWSWEASSSCLVELGTDTQGGKEAEKTPGTQLAQGVLPGSLGPYL